jgi:hypothetical protein
MITTNLNKKNWIPIGFILVLALIINAASAAE